MQSMTGYGRKVVQDDRYSIVAEVTAVNRKNLEVSLSAPKEWFNLDRIAVELAKERFLRGRLQLYVKCERLTSEDTQSAWDDELILERAEAFRKLCAKAGVEATVDRDVFLNLIRLNSTENLVPEWDAFSEKVTLAVSGAFDELAKMRLQEGGAIQRDLGQRLQKLFEIARRIEAIAPEVGPAYRTALRERLEQAELDLDSDDERVLKEIALFVDRSDISEEITRLKSHFDQLGQTLNKAGAIGRKIDFILQEIFRELNTIGSKANHIDISQSVIEGKNELERFREQAQNIE